MHDYFCQIELIEPILQQKPELKESLNIVKRQMLCVVKK